MSKVGRQGLVVANSTGAHGPFYDFRLIAVSNALASRPTLLEFVTILPFPARLDSFGVVPESVTSTAFSISWSPKVPLRVSLSPDRGVNFFSLPSSPFDPSHARTTVDSYINDLGVQESLSPGGAFIMRACPYDASRAPSQQQRPDGCSFLQITLAQDLEGVHDIHLVHLNSTRVTFDWSAPANTYVYLCH